MDVQTITGVDFKRYLPGANVNLLLGTPSGDAVLKIYHKWPIESVREKIRAQEALFAHLKQKGFNGFSGYLPVISSQYRDTSLHSLLIIENIPMTAQRSIGRPGTLDDYILFASTLGGFHESVKDYRITSRRVNPLVSTFGGSLGKIIDYYSQPSTGNDAILSSAQRIQRGIERLVDTLPSTIGQIMCHNDLSVANFRVEGANGYLVDFDGLNSNYRLMDFTQALLSFCYQKGEFDLAKASSFADAYRSVSKFSADESRFVADFLKMSYLRTINKFVHEQGIADPAKVSKALDDVAKFWAWADKHKEKINALASGSTSRPKTYDFPSHLSVAPEIIVGSNYRDISTLPLYKVLSEFDSNVPTEKTSYFQWFVNGRGASREDASEWVNAYRKKYEQARKKGIHGAISVNIDKNGRFLLNKGYEEVAVLRHLHQRSTTVEVVSRDSEWKSLVQDCYSIRRKPYLYQPIDHPEFAGWELARTEDRKELIAGSGVLPQSLQGQKWLDVGTNLGYFARFPASMGASVDAVELDPKIYRIAQRLNGVFGTNVQYHNANVVDWVREHKNDRYDGIMCLSIIHNIAQAGFPDQARETFRTLSHMAPQMIFDIGEVKEGGRVSKSGLDLSDIEKFIRENTIYTKITRLGQEQSYQGRTLYQLSV